MGKAPAGGGDPIIEYQLLELTEEASQYSITGTVQTESLEWELERVSAPAGPVSTGLEAGNDVVVDLGFVAAVGSTYRARARAIYAGRRGAWSEWTSDTR